MKKVILSLFLLSTFFVNSQTKNLQTTLDEYNYMLNGYKIAIENSMDIKSGYTVQDLGTVDIDGYKFQYNSFIRNDSKFICGIIIRCLSAWGNKYFIVLPIKNNELMADYTKSLDKFDKQFLQAYSSSLSVVFTNVLYNIETQIK